MITGFIDESGTISPGDASDVYTIALLLTHDPRPVEALIRRLRQSLHRRERTSELKAAQSDPTIIRRLLTRIGETESEIYIIVVDKIDMISGQSELIYQGAVARVVRHCLEYHPEVQLFLDKRYTKRSQRLQLEQTIREAIADVSGQVVLLEQAESWSVPGLQAVDFVAWAFQQKHAFGKPWAAEILADNTVVEEKVRGIKIAVSPGSR